MFEDPSSSESESKHGGMFQRGVNIRVWLASGAHTISRSGPHVPTEH